MNETLLYSILEVLGVFIFASEGLFIKDIELHYLENIPHDLVPKYINASNLILLTSI